MAPKNNTNKIKLTKDILPINAPGYVMNLIMNFPKLKYVKFDISSIKMKVVKQ